MLTTITITTTTPRPHEHHIRIPCGRNIESLGEVARYNANLQCLDFATRPPFSHTSFKLKGGIDTVDITDQGPCPQMTTSSRYRRTSDSLTNGERIHRPWQGWTRRRNATGVRSGVCKRLEAWSLSSFVMRVMLDRVESTAPVSVAATGVARVPAPRNSSVTVRGTSAQSRSPKIKHARSRRQR